MNALDLIDELDHLAAFIQVLSLLGCDNRSQLLTGEDVSILLNALYERIEALKNRIDQPDAPVAF